MSSHESGFRRTDVRGVPSGDKLRAMLRFFRIPTLVLLAACTSSTTTPVADADPLLRGDTLIIDGAVDASSRNWSSAPFLNEVPWECPLLDGIAYLPMTHEAHSLTAGEALTMDVTIEGRLFDPELTGQPFMAVYRGPLPTDEASARQCVDTVVKNQEEGVAGALTDISVAAGEEITIVAFTSGMAPYPGDRAGTYRVTVSTR